MKEKNSFNKLPYTYQIMMEAYISNNLLKKVRLKVDPINRNLDKFAYLNGYEGYILSEDIDNKTIDVMVMGDLDNPLIKNLPYDCVDQTSIVDPITKFKIATKTYLKHKLDIDCDNEIYKLIEISNTRKDIEKKLKEYGLNKEAINEIYKLYVLTNEPI